uniref:tRNA (guanine(46)-N(7))-methyltransferase n=1 Tax=Paulinella chromatophora TaxID=39717 RepID=B1X4U5_PAUCH|nr:tRNA (guanine-N(7)-)-methyltransferase [Paulinella chromatophora]ACB42964.1 tRNA (guanine-N(7)-)-methyltransferase [Paulinella chromatophora]
MRQHVNPLSRFFQLPLELPSLHTIFHDIDLPIHLDIGCARGRFLLKLAQLDPKWNYLGVEIRQSLVTAAEIDRKTLCIYNLYYMFCNATVSLQDWINRLSPGQIQRVTIQFPDPWFKKKHTKRRILQPDLLLSITRTFVIDNQLFLQSDVITSIESMIKITELSGCYNRFGTPWETTNPLLISTEREQYVQKKGLPIYRVLYKRNEIPLPSSISLKKAWKIQETINNKNSKMQIGR